MIRDRVGRTSQAGGVTPFRLENGVRCARVQSIGGADVLVVLDRAMDVAAASYAGVPLVWHGPGGIEPAHPATINDDAFQRAFFGGLVTTCGLEAFGPAGHDAYGSWGTHGHINHCRAEDLSFDVNLESDDAFAVVRGVVRQARMFGESLRLERTWTMSRDGTRLRLADRVCNEGGSSVPHMLLYHCNAGWPLLDEDTIVSITQRAMHPRDERAREGLDVWNRGGPPRANFKEQVYVHEPEADGDGWATARIANERLRLGFSVRFRPEQLPACFSWRMLGCRTYVMAVEPANCPTIEGRIAAEKRGTLPMLEPGQTRAYDLEFSFP